MSAVSLRNVKIVNYNAVSMTDRDQVFPDYQGQHTDFSDDMVQQSDGISRIRSHHDLARLSEGTGEEDVLPLPLIDPGRSSESNGTGESSRARSSGSSPCNGQGAQGPAANTRSKATIAYVAWVKELIDDYEASRELISSANENR